MKNRVWLTYLLISLVFCSYSQSKSSKWITIFSDNQIKVEVKFKIKKDVCNDLNSKNNYRYKITGSLYKDTKYCKWFLEYIDCNGNNIKEEQSVKIGGNNSKLGVLRSMDYQFRGELLNLFNSNPKKLYLKQIEKSVADNNFEKSFNILSKLKSLNTGLNIDSIKQYILLNANNYYQEEIQKLSVYNTYDRPIIKAYCIEAKDFLENTSYESYYNNFITQIKQIQFEEDTKKIRNSITQNLQQGYIGYAINEFNTNKDKYDIEDLRYSINNIGGKKAYNLLNEEKYNTAKSLFLKLYKFTDDYKYKLEANKIEHIIENIRINKIKQEYKLRLNDAKKENTEYLWKQVFYFANNNKDIISEKEAKSAKIKIGKFYKNKFRKSLKEVKKLTHNHNYYDAKSKIKVLKNDAFNYKYTPFYYSNLHIINKIDNKQDKIYNRYDKLDNKNKLYSYHNKYEKRKYSRKTFRIGLTYNFLSETPDYLLNMGTENVDTIENKFIIYNAQPILSRLSANIFYGRFGLYAGNYTAVESNFQINIGGYYKVVNSIYFKYGYIYNSNQDIKEINSINIGSPLYAGISLMTPIIHFEFGYNLMYDTYNLGIGINIFFRKKNTHYTSEKTEYRYWKNKL